MIGKKQLFTIIGIIILLWIAAVSLINSNFSMASENRLPNFTLNSLENNEIELNGVLKEKPVVLSFWATWCPNCQRHMPIVQDYYDELSDDVEILAVDLREPRALVEEFVDRNKITYPILLDTEGIVGIEYDVAYTNYHVLINQDGTLFKEVLGDLSKEDIEELIAANL
jgi:thiol-disulfide isomerase/thioredoxin